MAPYMADRRQAFLWVCGPREERAVSLVNRMFWVSLNSCAASVLQVPIPNFSQKHTTAMFSFFLLVSRKKLTC